MQKEACTVVLEMLMRCSSAQHDLQEEQWPHMTGTLQRVKTDMLVDTAEACKISSAHAGQCIRNQSVLCTWRPTALMPSEDRASTAESNTGWRLPVMATAAPCKPVRHWAIALAVATEHGTVASTMGVSHR